MSLSTQTHQAQSAMARYCRTGESSSLPQVPLDRAAVYRRLVFNVVESTLQRSYPITHLLFEGDRWVAMINAFLEEHDAYSPYLWRMAKELYEWEKTSGYGEKIGVPYLTELLYFEWLEIEIYMMPDRDAGEYVRDGDVWEDTLILNPEHSLDAFQFPVFRAKAERMEEQKGRYYLITYRHPDTLKVRFLDLSPLHALVLELLKREPMSGEEAFELAASHFGLSDTDALEARGREFLQSLWDQKVILGVQR